MPSHLTLTVSGCKRQDLLCGHSNHDIFTCEDIKISCFRAKVHLVFLTNGKRLSVYYCVIVARGRFIHWCLAYTEINPYVTMA